MSRPLGGPCLCGAAADADNLPELAVTLSGVLDREVVYQELEPGAHLAARTDAGLDEATTEFVVALDGNIRDGELTATSSTLGRLIGRPTTPLIESLQFPLPASLGPGPPGG